MKKILAYVLIFVLVCFLIPVVLTKKAGKQVNTNIYVNEQNNSEVAENTAEYNYNKYNTIKLLHTKTQEIEEIKLDEYLYGVVSAEMPASFEKEALKAQAVVARTYTIYKIENNEGKHGEANICDDSGCCQAWISKEDRFAKWEEASREANWNKIVEAVESTKGKYITYEGKPINAFFHSNSGGITEVPVNVWGGTGYPYLQSVETSGENTYTQYASEVRLSQEELINKLKEKYSDISIDFTNSDDIKILEYTESTRVKTVKFGNHEISGVEARTLFGLKSTNFEISRDGNNIKFSVKGYGHGVGMSQTGADSMAKNGSRAEEIIKHFYTGVEITEVNKL